MREADTKGLPLLLLPPLLLWLLLWLLLLLLLWLLWLLVGEVCGKMNAGEFCLSILADLLGPNGDLLFGKLIMGPVSLLELEPPWLDPPWLEP